MVGKYGKINLDHLLVSIDEEHIDEYEYNIVLSWR